MSSQVLGSLSFLDTPDVSGNLILTTATGVSQGNIAGTAGIITVVGTTNIVIDIADNPIIPGTAGMVVPVGITAQRGAAPVTGTLRFNTTLNLAEVYSSTAWYQLGRILQTVVGNIAATTGTGNKTTTTIPLDTEGIQIWSKVLTPIVAGSTILIQFSVSLAQANSGTKLYVAVFAGATCVGMSVVTISTNNGIVSVPMQCAFVTPSTAAITFTARTGTLATNAAHFVNQTTGSVTYGNALSLDFRLTEMAP